MQLEINKLTLTDIFALSSFIKERVEDLSTLEEVAQEIMKGLSGIFVTSEGKSEFVLSRFFKSCTYEKLPKAVQEYIQRTEGKKEIPPQNKYLTLLGTWGDLKDWQDRARSNGHQALPLYDPQTIREIPMLSATLNQIGFDIDEIVKPDKSIIIDKQDKEYGVFSVEEAKGSKFIPRQQDFVEPFGVKSVFGFGSMYKTKSLYGIIIFSRVKISAQKARLFLSLNPVIKLVTLKHELTGNLFKS
ncbi:MAG: hypothetical protein KKD11_02215 [Candidatus Omnitrophica bacterium]|nr:hypothetical protein [Candidatus Omnitrophota bacterium]